MPRGINKNYNCNDDFHTSTFIPTSHQQKVLDYFPTSSNKGLLLYHQLGSGKCLAFDTEILLHDGTIKKVQDVKIGDQLMGDDSKPREVISLVRGKDEMYDIIPVKGEKYTVNSEHILCLKGSGFPYVVNSRINNSYNIQWIKDNEFKSKTFTYKNNDKEDKKLKEQDALTFKNLIKEEQILEISVVDYLKLSKSKKACLKGYRKSVEFSKKEIPIDPYMIGYWLGDGSSRSSLISSQDSTVLHYFHTNLNKYDLSLNHLSKYDYSITGYTGKYNSNVFLNALKNYNLLNNKHIPYDYKCNSRENRLKLLAGLIDSDGHLSKGGFEFTQTNEVLMNDVIYLARSLGFCCYKKYKKTSWTYKDEKKDSSAWRIHINGKGIEEIPTLIPRKQANIRKQIKDVLNTGIKVDNIGVGDYYGFEINGNRRFLLGDFTVTHNTCTSIMIADQMLKNNQIEKVYVLTPGSLRSGWINQYCKVCGLTEEYIKDNFIFITYNYYDKSSGLQEMDFNNSLLIIDEVHNFINGVRNDAKTPTILYNKIVNSNSRVLALSGTPPTNDIQWKLLHNILKINSNSLEGIVSYFPGDKQFYPTIYYKPPIKVDMSLEQTEKYIMIYNREKKARTIKPPDSLRFSDPGEYKKQMVFYILALKWQGSRKISNVYYPLEFTGIPDLLTKDGGWIDDESLNDQLLLKMSPKFIAIILNITTQYNTKHVIYTFYKKKSGVQLFSTLLNKCGIKARIFSGDLSDTSRKSLLNIYNSKENRNGNIIKVLLVTEAGAEGIDLLETNNIHIVESSTTEKKTSQAIGRVIRYKSHYDMPKNRQYVNVWRYFSMPFNTGVPSIDEELYYTGIEKAEINEVFLTRLIESSI